jgi:pSer/pThr/pTyr-binding forkhead associated (FHA) protein
MEAALDDLNPAYLDTLTVSELPAPVPSDLIRGLVNLDYGLLGRTVSTRAEPNTSGEFRFRLTREAAASRSVDIGSIVAAISEDRREVVFGAVNQLDCYGPADSIVSDDVVPEAGDRGNGGEADANVIVATCAVVQTLSGKARPITRSRIFFPTALGVQFAIGIVNTEGASVYKGAAIPVGIFENGDGTIAPVSIDENFMVGPEAAHLNVSGISGLASKTSTLQFCLKSLLTKSKKKIGVVVINVKSNDLLYIDQINPHLTGDAWSAKVYQDLGIPIEPFVGTRFYAPSHPKKRGSTMSQRALRTEPFRWDLNMLYRDLPSLFDKSQDDGTMEGAWLVIREEIERGTITTYASMLAWVDKLLTMSGLTEWPKGYAVATWRRLKAELKRCTQQYRGLIAEGEDGSDIPWDELRDKHVFIIDIEMLSVGGQRLVLGRCVRALTDILENSVNGLESVVIFVDELNKFASKSEKSAIKSQLIEVTARGRTLGLVLFGAEQFASSVDMEIVENSATFMFGRTESTELTAANYNGLTPEMKSKLRMLPQGQTLIKFPKFQQPIFIKFPYPPALLGADYRPAAPPVGVEFPSRLTADEAANRGAITDRLPAESASQTGATSPALRGRAAPVDGAGSVAVPVAAVPTPVTPDKASAILPQIKPGSLLARYQAGDCEAVWEEMGDLGEHVRDAGYYDDAWSVARETMRRARHNVELLIRRLDELNYHFRAAAPESSDETDKPQMFNRDVSVASVRHLLRGLGAARGAQSTMRIDHLQDRNVFLPATPREAEVAMELEAQGVVLPLSLRAWFEEVGRVDLTGSHPTLSFLQGKSAHWGLLRITDPGGRRLCYGLSRTAITIGRSHTAGNDIVLSDALASTLHARIQLGHDNDVTVHDLGSTNGVRVKGVPVAGGVAPLADGDEIEIGTTKLSFHLVGGDRPGRGEAEGLSVDPFVVYPTASWLMELVRDELPITGEEQSDLYVSPYDTDKTSRVQEVQHCGYTIAIPNAAADAPLVGEGHKTNFVNYLRKAFQWGGFPGWEQYKNRPTSEIEFLTQGLLPL